MYRKFIKEERGQALILLAIIMTAVVGASALAIDFGRSVAKKADLQNAADFASLGGTMYLPDTSVAVKTATDLLVEYGYDANDFEIITPVDGNDERLQVTISQEVPQIFGHLLGKDYQNVKATSLAGLFPLGADDPFHYAIFSSSDKKKLNMNGTIQEVYGDIHANNQVIINGTNIIVEGTVKATSSILTNGSFVSIEKESPYQAYEELPFWPNDLLIQKSSIVVDGDLVIESGDYPLNSMIYVRGNVTVNGTSFEGTGSIIAEGDITLNGTDHSFTSNEYVALYSMQNITLNGNNMNLDGILFAPNGQITLNGNAQTINGSIVGDEVNVNGVEQRVYYEDASWEALPVRKSISKLLN